ncbi:MAG TPA: M48 family metallopeptidase [Vicinamibacteria bacterium]|nr:M48 family metallopeptidase [Vicinamibacteria bacterium]
MPGLFLLFLALRLAQQVAETALARLNRRHALDPGRLAEAGRALDIGEGEMAKAVAYSSDRHRFGLAYGWAEVVVGLAFLAAGGLGIVEAGARRVAGGLGLGPVAAGLAFFAILGLLTALFELPFDLYATFRIEERHGFNRQTLGGFLLDRLKGVAIAVVLGGPMLAAILWLMGRMGPSWWLWAWGVTTAFSLFAAWIYPAVLAPLFNRFTPLPDGELREAILALARRTGFRAGGISVMDASRRTAHGNAYFTGVFGQKRIVLFDTLLEAMGSREVVAVLAHELGHFKLHHVRWAMARGIATSGLVFYVLSLCLPLAAFYSAFSLERSAYGALAVFGLWFSLVSFLLHPLENALSRRHEFAADTFALRNGATATELGDALRKLSEKSRHLPVTHPLYSRIYHSHPPLLERLRAMGALGPSG